MDADETQTSDDTEMKVKIWIVLYNIDRLWSIAGRIRIWYSERFDHTDYE